MKYFKTITGPNHLLSINFCTSVKVNNYVFIVFCLTALEKFFSEFLKNYSANGKLLKNQYSLDLHFVGSWKMQRINSEHRKKNYPTDVLSFPSVDWSKQSHRSLEYELMQCDFYLGDIVVCKDVAIKQAQEYKITEKEEFIHLLVHGFLHLIGYDHEKSDKDARQMFKMEKKILDEISSQKGSGKKLQGRF